MSRRATITSLGRFVPEKILTNDDLAKMVDTSNEWIVERTGIRERHIAAPGVATSDLATEAARKALERRGVTPSEVDLIIVATVTPDMLFPATACLVQDKLRADNAWGFDLSAACCGFLYALTTGAHFVSSGAHQRVLVIGADVMSSIVNYKDRATCVLFGDGAGAILLEATDDGGGLLDFEPPCRRQRWLLPLHARRRKPAPFVRRDRRKEDALRAPERPPDLQVRDSMKLRVARKSRAFAHRNRLPSPPGTGHRRSTR